MKVSRSDLLASELKVAPRQVDAVLTLFKDGATVPFIARYRKEATGNLDEVQIRAIQERNEYLTQLDDRRTAIVSSVREQGKLTPELEAKLMAADSKAALEDLYAPFKPKRRTRGTMAQEKGLLPLAERILAQTTIGDPAAEAAAYVSEERGVKSAEEALQGARDIVAEVVADNSEIRTLVRTAMVEHGVVASQPVPEKTKSPTKFEQYYSFREAFKTIPSHRFLAIRRGEREGVLKLHVELDGAPLVARMHAIMGVSAQSPFARDLSAAIQDGYDRLIVPSVETDVRVDVKMRADREAVEVFSTNLKSLLLSAPLGARSVIGIDPGVRTGCKCAAVDMTGKFLDAVTIYPTQKAEEAAVQLLAFVAKHQPYALAIGNGTHGRETETFTRKALLAAKVEGVIVVSVNESGASVYSASDVARDEFPNLDLTVRGAISIARRLQDPLAELVKIDPKAIGVGQYQHDVHQPLLARKLDEVVESCVNHVGVELNTASAPLLARVAGIGPALAKKIVAHREERGAFKSRADLHEVAGLGPRAFEQAAGFLRVRNSDHPLDDSAVHPERYDLVARIARDLGVELAVLVGNRELAKNIDVEKYVGEGVGVPTLKDIVSELQKPGRDPRETFTPPKFRDDVFSVEDLKPGMTFEGVVTNVTAFGAFVDIGVHQDGLVHVSQLANGFVKNPAEVVKAGDKLQVRVLEVDLQRKRIALSAKSEQPRVERPRREERRPDRQAQSEAQARGRGGRRGGGRQNDRREQPQQPEKPRFSNNPFANLKIR